MAHPAPLLSIKPVKSEVLFHRVARHEGIEVGLVFPGFGAQDAAQALGFFLPRAERAGNLDGHRRVGQVRREVGDLGDNQLAQAPRLKLGVDLIPLSLGSAARQDDRTP
jgi:hypothetical protein